LPGRTSNFREHSMAGALKSVKKQIIVDVVSDVS